MMITPWWCWATLGLILLAIEVLAPGGFFILFFGLGALLVSALILFGVPLTLGTELILFSLFSIILLLAFRKALLLRFKQGSEGKVMDFDTLVGMTCVASSEIPPGGTGRVDARGTTWSAKNISANPIHRGAHCRVAEHDGLLLKIIQEK